MAKPLDDAAVGNLTTTASDLETALGTTIAQRLRSYRHDLGLTISRLAEMTGLSKGMLSKIENNQSSPSLTSLARLAAAMEVPVTAFFRGLEEERDALFVKAGHGVEIVREGTRSGHRYELLGSGRGPHRRMEPVLITLEKATEVFPLFQHPGTELIYMMEGVMEYGHGSARYRMAAGDSLQFDGEVPHGPTSLEALPIRFLSIKAYGAVRDDEDLR